MKRAIALALGSVVLAAVACGHDPPSPAASRVTHDATLPTAPRYGFFPTTGALEAIGQGYRARVAADDGAISVTAGPSPLALAIRTTSIERGRSLWTARDPSAVSLRAGSVAITRGPATEDVVATRASVEQSWRFASPPPGQGPLRVRVRATGGLRLSEDAGGVRATAPGARLAYRDAVWIDAHGARTALPMKLAGEEILLEVPADVVDRSAYPSTLDPTIGPELSLDAPVVGVPRNGAYNARIATGKDGVALVVWDDYRVEAPFANSMFSGSQLIGARIAPDGKRLDPTGLVVANERDFYYSDLSVTYDGVKNWFVAWTQTGMNAPYDQLWGALVDDQGKVLWSVPATGADGAYGVATAFDGANFVVLFAPDVYATRFSPTGQPLDALPKLISTAAFATPAIACRAAGACLAAWPTTSGAQAVRLGANLAIEDATPIAVTNTSAKVTGVTYDGQSWVVSVGTTLVRIDPATGLVVGPPTSTGSDAIATITSDGASTWAAWPKADGQVGAARMTQAGTLDASGPFAWTTDAKAEAPVIAFGGGTLYLAHDDSREAQYVYNVYAGRISPGTGAPVPGDAAPINRAANGQVWPAVATSATNHLVSWSDYRDTTTYDRAAYAARIAADGTLLDATATLLDPRGFVTAAASDGTDYLVVWQASGSLFDSTSKIRAARISGATGAVLGTAIEVAARGWRPSVAFDGAQFVVAWLDAGLYAQRVSTAGALVGGAIQLSTAPTSNGEGAQTDIASNGTDSLVVSTGGTTGIQGVRIDKNGQVLDPTPIAVGDGPGRQYFPKVTWDGAQWVAVWEDYRAGHIIDPEIYGSRISANGTVVPPGDLRIGSSPTAQVFPAVVGMGDGYSTLVAWSDDRNPARYQDFALTGTWMRRSDGKLLDRDPVTLSDRAGNEIGAALAPAGAGRVLLAYHVMDATAGFGNTRVRVRFIGSGTAAGQTCTKDEDCVTRSCTDGVCCDRACRGTCETCSATPGTCTAVVNGEDPDTCAGENVCGAQRDCKRKQGRGCAVDADCASGVCAQGVCCDRRCDSPCETCPAGTGACALRPARSAGAPTCAPYACDGQSATCPGSCMSDAACPSSSRCDTTAGVCVSGTACVDARTALLPDQSTVDCTPYTCASGACRTSCRNVADCVSPAICDEVGQCVLPPGSAALGSGCTTAPSTAPFGGGGGAWLVLLGSTLLALSRRQTTSLSASGPRSRACARRARGRRSRSG